MAIQTQTFEQSLAHDTYSTQELQSWEYATQFVSSLANDPNFIEYTTGLDIDSDSQRSFDYAYALSEYAESYVGEYADMFDEQAAEQIRIIANMPYAAYASVAIDLYNQRRKRGERLPESEWEHYNTLKAQTVWYNQMTNVYMYRHGNESFGTISQAAAGTMLDYVPHHDISLFEQKATDILRGARTEAAARHFIESLEPFGISVRAATIEEDLHGADIVVSFGSQQAYIDIKASLNKLAEEAHGYEFTEQGNMYHLPHAKPGRQQNVLLFPGFTDNDLGDSMRLSDKITDERRMAIGSQLTRIFAALKMR